MIRGPGRSARLRALEELRAPEGVEANARLDTVGLYCPVPIIKTSEKMLSISSGEILEVLSDDRVILMDMPAWCLSNGHTYLGFRESGGEWRLYVRKK